VSSSEYVASFFLVILGFAVSEVLKGSARLIRERRKIKFYWPYLVVVPFVFEVLIVVFIFLFGFVDGRADANWSLPEIIGVALLVAPIALSSYLMFPSGIEEGFDLRKFYFENAKVILIVNMIQALVFLVYMVSVGDVMGITVQIIYVTFTGVVLVKFERLHLIWLFSMIALINFAVFFNRTVSIGG
jgi:hypothetical protein